MNRKFNCIIIDDEPIALDIINNYIEQLDSFEVVGSFTNALESLKVVHSKSVDLIFLDIEMPGISGLDFAKSLPSNTSIVFTTAYRNYAVDAFDLDVVDYLLKPIAFDRFLKAINKFYKHIETNSKQPLVPSVPSVPPELPQTIELKSDKKTYRINPSEIICIESLEDYIKVNTTKHRLIVHSRMHEIETLLGNEFVRIHRSYLVNSKFVIAYTSSQVEIEGNTFPIGRTYRGQVMEKLRVNLK